MPSSALSICLSAPVDLICGTVTVTDISDKDNITTYFS